MLTSFTYKALDINYLIVSSMKLTAIFSGMSSLPQFPTVSLLSFQPVSEMLYSQQIFPTKQEFFPRHVVSTHEAIYALAYKHAY